VTEKEYLVATAAFTYFGPARVRLLVSYFKTAKKVWESPSNDLVKIGLSEKRVQEFSNFRKNFNAHEYFSRLSKMDIKVTTFLDKNFPKSLKDLDAAPVVLYYKGSLEGLNKNSVAIVGARKMTPYGCEVTEMFSSQLVNFGVTIISGLARGVDTVAHRSCLAAGGITIAVLGNGLNSIYPPENKSLADEIIKKGGAIISEYPPEYPVFPVNFVARNRIVSGLSTCVLVIEGAEKSGTLLTASHAANQGKTVFAVPGNITSPLSKAPLSLLKKGALIATETNDLLDELNLEARTNKRSN
jgi:DNA processing protein